MNEKGKNPFVSIIIVHYGEIRYLKECIESIITNTLYPKWEIIIINNGDSLNIKELNFVLMRENKDINILNTSQNLGYAGSINLGSKFAKGSILAILNNDVKVGKSWLFPLVECLKQKENIAGCQGKILSLKKENKFDYAGAAGGYIDIYGYPFCRGRIFETIEDDKGQYDNETEVFWICGVCMAIKKIVLEKVGVFDEEFFMYGEEIDWCWRTQLLGYKFMFVPDSLIYHVGSANTQRWHFYKKIYYLHRNHLIILIKNYTMQKLLFILPIRFMLEFLAMWYYLFQKKFWACVYVAKAINWVIINYLSIYKKRGKIQKRRTVSDRKIMKKMFQHSLVLFYYIRRKKYFPKIYFK